MSNTADSQTAFKITAEVSADHINYKISGNKADIEANKDAFLKALQDTVTRANEKARAEAFKAAYDSFPDELKAFIAGNSPKGKAKAKTVKAASAHTEAQVKAVEKFYKEKKTVEGIKDATGVHHKTAQKILGLTK